MCAQVRENLISLKQYRSGMESHMKLWLMAFRTFDNDMDVRGLLEEGLLEDYSVYEDSKNLFPNKN